MYYYQQPTNLSTCQPTHHVRFLTFVARPFLYTRICRNHLLTLSRLNSHGGGGSRGKGLNGCKPPTDVCVNTELTNVCLTPNDLLLFIPDE
jgi:hypothetical protein